MAMRNVLTQTYNLSDEKLAQFDHLFRVFQAENKIINLSAIRDEESVWEEHFLDSLLATPFLFEGEKIIDLGSGGGFPLLVLALYFPTKTSTLVCTCARR